MKWFKRVLFSVLGISLVIGGFDLYSRYVDNNTFRAVDAINGIYLGQSREDLLFLRDLKLNCSDSDVPPSECDAFHILEPRSGMTKTETGGVNLEFDRVVRVQKLWGLPYLRINDTEDLVRRLGEANIYSISSDFTIRSYSYVDRPWTFHFEKNQLRQVELGKVRNGHALNLAWYIDEDGSYFRYDGSKILVRGRQVCPGSECPFKDGDRVEDEILDAKELEELLLGKVE